MPNTTRVRVTVEAPDLDVYAVIDSQDWTNAIDAKVDVRQTINAQAAQGNVTLFDAATVPMGAPAFVCVIVDPDRESVISDTTAIVVEVAGDGGSKQAFSVTRRSPLLMNTSTIRPTITGANENLATIKVRNEHASQNVPVRLIAIK